MDNYGIVKKWDWSHERMPARVVWATVEPIDYDGSVLADLPRFTRAYIDFDRNGRHWTFESLYSGGPSGHYIGRLS